ncbi:MAG: polysaccharide biosynthesis/export family protein, partial [Aeromonadaceae bacterium]
MLTKWLLLISCLLASLSLQAEPIPANRYTLGAGDVIKVSVYDHPDLQFEAEITDDGTLSVPLINRVKLAGLTFSQAENEIAKRLEQGGYVQEAHVNILITGYRSQLVSVIGEVNRP